MRKVCLALRILLLLLLAAAPLCAQNLRVPKKAFELYAEFTVDTKVELSDGSEWAMDKGDCFPVDMFKEQQTKVVLKLGNATFITDATRLRILKEDEFAHALESYRTTLDAYLKSRSNRWKEQASGDNKSGQKAKSTP